MSNKNGQIAAVVCVFKRTKISPWEQGLAIGVDGISSDVKLIVDMNYQVVTYDDMYDYRLIPSYGCVLLFDAVSLAARFN